MSKTPNHSDTRRQILGLLLEGRLGEALQLIGVQINDVTDWHVTSEFENLSTSYNYMLQYFGQGVPDAERSNLFKQLTGRAILLNDDAYIQSLLPSSTLLYFQARRQSINHPIDYPQSQSALERFAAMQPLPAPCNDTPELIRILSDHETLLSNIFTSIWISGLWSRNEIEQITDILNSSEVLAQDKSLIISAISLALMERFDPGKISILGQFSSNPDIGISIRSLTGFVFGIIRYDRIIPYFPGITSLLQLMSDSIDIQTGIQSIQLALFLSRETDETDRKMRDEIIPAMIRNIPNNPANDNTATEDINPDWDKWMDKSDIQKRLMEMTEMQLEGADIYMSTFSNLKNYPFFKQLSGWFRAFDANQPDVRASFTGTELLKTNIGHHLLSSDVFCNSDKYSLCFTFQQIPESQRKSIIDQIISQNEDIEESLENRPKTPVQYDKCVRQYIQDIYRFVKLYPRRHEFWDPFPSQTNLFNIDSLKPFVSAPQFERTAAEFLLKKKHYAEASVLFDMLLSHNGPESTDWQIWQKMGYSLQKTGKYDDSIEAYLKADILEPDNTWTLKHIALAWRDSGNSYKAVEYLLQLEKIQPDDIQLSLLTGECLMSIERYDEALNRFFKVEYQQPQSIQAKRDIAWCYFLCNRYEQSHKYWSQLLSESKDNLKAADYLNSGHLEWCSGNLVLAISLYSCAKKMTGEEEFLKLLQADRPILLSHGIQQTDFMLMLDLLRK